MRQKMSGSGAEPRQQATGLVQLMMRIIESPGSGLDLVELAGELVAETARFNVWVLGRKSRSTAHELWNIASLEDRCFDDCSSAWDRYATELGDKSSSRDQLRSTMRSVTDRLRAARTGDSVEFEDPEMPEELRGL
jgi:hypothetical protein